MTRCKAIHYLSRFNIESVETMKTWQTTRLLESVKFIKEQLKELS